jgi:uncharacterized membrane protein
LRIRCCSRNSQSRLKLINSFLSYSCSLILLLAENPIPWKQEVNTASPLAPLLAASLTPDAATSWSAAALLALAFAVAFPAAAVFWAAAFPFFFPFPFAFFLAATAAPAFAVAFLALPAMTAFSFATLAEAWASAAVYSHPLALSSLIEEKME